MLIKNQIYEATIVDYTAEGQGIAKIDGCVVFIPNAIVGEVCRIRIEKAQKTWATGVLVEILQKSPHRIQRECPISSSCGGCDFWHMDYEEEARLKADRVLQALNRIGGESLTQMPILSAPTCYGYRNKAQYPYATEVCWMNKSLPPPSCKNRSTMTAILTANTAETFGLTVIRYACLFSL